MGPRARLIGIWMLRRKTPGCRSLLQERCGKVAGDRETKVMKASTHMIWRDCGRE